MKTLVCEMCGNNQLIKENGVFVCQACGTQYSVEEAKKMMIEGTVDVQGTVEVEGTVEVQGKVSIDNSSMVDKYVKMAESSYNAGNQSEAEMYASKALEIDNKNYYAWRIKGLSAGWQTTLAKSRTRECVKYMVNALEYAPEDLIKDVREQVKKDVSSLLLAEIELACNHFAKFPDKKNSKNITDMVQGHIKLMSELLHHMCILDVKEYQSEVSAIILNKGCDAWNSLTKEYKSEKHPSKYDFEKMLNGGSTTIALIEYANAICKDDKKKIIMYSNLIMMHNYLTVIYSMKYTTNGYVIDLQLSKEAKEARIDKIMEYHQAWKELDPSHEIPKRPKAGCYVATCVYGSYNCPQVWTLRRYRDNTLGATWYGRAFIKLYYAISPTLVKWFGHTKWFKKMWRGKLDRMVKKLNDQGVEDSPYYDNYL